MKDKILDNLLYILIIILLMATLVDLNIPIEKIIKLDDGITAFYL